MFLISCVKYEHNHDILSTAEQIFGQLIIISSHHVRFNERQRKKDSNYFTSLHINAHILNKNVDIKFSARVLCSNEL